MKRIAFLLAALLILTSCGQQSSTSEGTTASEVNDATVSETTVPTVEVKDMNGRVFTVYTRYNSDGWDWNASDFHVESQNGEPVNDAVYKRNQTIAERYNCSIEAVRSSDPGNSSDAKNSILAGDASYDAHIISARNNAAFASEELLIDLNTLSSLDLTASYWNPSVLEKLSIGGKLYYAIGELSATDNRAVRCLYFNKKLIEDNKLDDPYELVKSGKWTHEKFFSMLGESRADLNGDGEFTDADRYGLFCQSSIGTNLFYSSGEQYVSKDSSDLLISAIDGGRVTEVLSKVSERIGAASDALVLSNDYQTYQKLFSEDKALFYAEVSLFIERFRQFDFEVGMLPMPKFDETQEEYCQFADGFCLNYASIPVTCKDAEEVALILEALSLESESTLTPAYYEICLTGKSIRDNESEEMLDIIFGSYTIDNGDLFSFSSIGTINSAISSGKEIASALESVRTTLNEETKKINEKFTT